MDRNYVFENAPLKEVIVECYWRLKGVSIAPGAAIDPFWDIFEQEFSARMTENGFTFREALANQDIPKELLGHQVTRRFRPSANTWPVYQIGAGILTVNETPPYDGWRNFSDIVRNGFSHLANSYPLADRYMHLDRVTVRYLNSFSERHGLTSPGTFLRDHLQLAVELPQAVRAAAGEREHEIAFTGSVSVPVSRLSDGTGNILWGEGKEDGKPVARVEFRVTKVLNEVGTSVDNLCGAANECHSVISDWFEDLVAARLGSALGARRMLDD